MKHRKLFLCTSVAFLLTLSATGCAEERFQINWETQKGFKFLSANKEELPKETTKNTQVYFLLETEEGYDTSFEVKANTNLLEPVNGVYSFEVTADTTITVEGLDLLKFSSTVTAPEGVRLTLKGTTNNPIPSSIEWGTEISFETKVDEGYVGTPEVYLNGTKMAKEADGSYKITVTSDLNLEVKGIYKEITGDGTKENPYTIYNAHNLIDFAQKYNAGTGELVAQHLVIANDIDLGGIEWTSIGNDKRPFTGVVTGNGHTISNLKITTVDTVNQYSYGLFGAAYNLVVRDLNVTGTIDVNDNLPESDKQAIYAGLVCGMALGVDFVNVRAEGQVKVLSKYADQVGTGGVLGAISGERGFAYKLLATSFKGSVESDAKTSLSGGLIGIETGSSSVLSIQNAVVDATLIKAKTIAGGVSAQLPLMDSISNSSVKVGTLEQLDEKGAAGGVAAVCVEETAILNNIVEIGTLKAAATKKGYVAGVITPDLYKDNYDAFGTALFNNKVLTNDQGAVETHGEIINKTNINKALTDSLGLSQSVFNVKDGELPTLVATPTYKDKVDVTIHNLTQDALVKVNDATYDPINYKLYAEKAEGKLAAGLYYDKEGKVPYRAYAPITGDGVELYLLYTDFAKISGLYTGYCSMSTEEKAVTKDLTLEFFADGTASFVNQDFETITYNYWTDGANFFMESDYNDYAFFYENGSFKFFDKATSDESYYYNFRRAGNEFYGYYELDNDAIIIIRNDKKLYCDGSEYSYTVTKDGFSFSGAYDYVITKTATGFEYTWNDPYEGYSGSGKATYTGHYPDYSKETFVGKKYYLGLNFANNDEVTFLGNGNIDINHWYSTSGYSKTVGSYREMTSNELRIRSRYFNSDRMKYNKTKDIFVGKNKGGKAYIIAPTKTLGRYESKDGIVIFRTETDNYILKNGSLNTYAKVEGTFGEGLTIKVTIYGKTTEYKIFADTLVEVANVDKTPVSLTYEGTIDGVKSELTLIKDGTGTLDGKAIKYTFDGKNVEFSLDGTTYKLVFDSTKKTLIGTGTSGATTKTVNFAEKVVVKEIYGKWECLSPFGAKVILQINNDGTVTFDGIPITNPTVGKTNCTFEYNYETYSFTFNPTTDKMTGTFTYDYSDYTYKTITRIA